MFEYLSQHPLAAVALTVLVILTIYMWIKAVAASRRHGKERDAEIARIENEKALRAEFRYPDETTFAPDKDDYRLITGMCAHVQMSIEKEPDINAAFEGLSEVRRNVYCLGYVFEDSTKKLSEFFRSNGEPMLSAARSAVDSIIGGEFADLFDNEYVMLDENDETTSVDNAMLEEWDGQYAGLMEADGEAILGAAADYIRANKAEFLGLE